MYPAMALMEKEMKMMQKGNVKFIYRESSFANVFFLSFACLWKPQKRACIYMVKNLPSPSASQKLSFYNLLAGLAAPTAVISLYSSEVKKSA